MNLLPGSSEPRLPELPADLAAWLDGLDLAEAPARLEAFLRALPAPRSSLHSPERMAEAAERILAGFREAGWTAARRPYEVADVEAILDHGDFAPHRYERLVGANVVAERPGERSDEAVVVLGHYDTVRDSPGANDNGSAVTALVELARLLAPFRFERRIVLAATDMEEIGFFGARALVAELQAAGPLRGAVNFEELGYRSTEPGSQKVPPGLGLIFPDQLARLEARERRGDFTLVIYNGAARACAAAFAAALARRQGGEAPLLLRGPADLPLVGPLLARSLPAVRNFARSDHVPFWQAGIPAIQITDTANFRYPHYHKATDTPDKLDYRLVADIVAAAAAVVAREAVLLAG